VLVDALSFLWSEVLIWRIQAPEPHPREGETDGQRRRVWRDIVEGVRVVAAHPLLRLLVAVPADWNVSWSILLAVFVLYTTRDVGLGAGSLGLVVAGSGVGSLVGATLVGPLTRRIGLGPALVAPPLLAALGALSFGLARGPSAESSRARARVRGRHKVDRLNTRWYDRICRRRS